MGFGERAFMIPGGKATCMMAVQGENPDSHNSSVNPLRVSKRICSMGAFSREGDTHSPHENTSLRRLPPALRNPAMLTCARKQEVNARRASILPRSLPTREHDRSTQNQNVEPGIDGSAFEGHTNHLMFRCLATPARPAIGPIVTPPRRNVSRRSIMLAIAVLLGAGPGSLLLSSLAHAEFRLCNRTQSRIGIAVGYKEGNTWHTEGWWNVAAESCETLLRGDLMARYYYIYAVDYDLGGEWTGKAYMCTRDKEFTIRGSGDCLARGFERTGFMEVDTQGQKSWTVQFTSNGQQQSASATKPGAAPMPPALPANARKD